MRCSRQKVVEGGSFVPMRAEGSGTSIDWDNDFCADPCQVGPDGEDYFIADPTRDEPEDFDRIFVENDEQRLMELERLERQVGLGGTIPADVIDDLKISSRPSSETDALGRRAGRQSASVQETNVVDPWGKRRPRFGIRQKVSSGWVCVGERECVVGGCRACAWACLGLGAARGCGLASASARRVGVGLPRPWRGAWVCDFARVLLVGALLRPPTRKRSWSACSSAMT